MFKIKKIKNRLIIYILFIKFSFKITNNKIILIDENGFRKKLHKINGLDVKFTGLNSKIIIHSPIKSFNNCKIKINNSSTVEIQNNSNINNFDADIGPHSKLKIGKNFYCGSINAFIDKDSSLIIGDDCMFSNNIVIRCGDGTAHKIIDLNTNKEKSLSGHITIKDHVWVGLNATLLKKAFVNKDSIVGTNAVVTKAFKDTNIAIAGNPAKIVQRNINWKS